MKLICIMLSLTMLWTGCSTRVAVTKNVPPPTDVDVVFLLNDGTRVISREYARVDSGYSVIGKLVSEDNPKSRDFSGVIRDEQIHEVTTRKCNTGATIALVAFAGVVVALAVAFASVRGFGALNNKIN